MKSEEIIKNLEQKVKELTEENLKLKNIETELKFSKDKLKIIFDEAPEAYFISDTKGDFIDGNKAAEKLIGYKKEELIRKNMTKVNLVPLDQIPVIIGRLAEHALGRATKPGEIVILNKDGKRISTEVSGNMVKMGGKSVVLGIVRDITEKKKAEEEIRNKNKELEKFNSMAVGRELQMVELKKKITDLEEKLKKR